LAANLLRTFCEPSREGSQKVRIKVRTYFIF
jgi:hypothetical protein